MIIDLKDKNLIIKEPIDLIISTKTKENIKKYWQKFIRNNPNCYNGDVYNITNTINNKKEIILELKKIKYEDLVYNQKYPNYKTRSLFVASYFITKDNKYCLIKTDHDVINLIGGMADTKDFDNNILIPIKSLKREIKEELSIDIDNEYFINKKIKYLKIPNKEEENNYWFTTGIIYELKLSITSNELINIFKKNKHKTDGEIKEIIIISNINDLNNYPKKASYLYELFSKITNKA